MGLTREGTLDWRCQTLVARAMGRVARRNLATGTRHSCGRSLCRTGRESAPFMLPAVSPAFPGVHLTMWPYCLFSPGTGVVLPHHGGSGQTLRLCQPAGRQTVGPDPGRTCRVLSRLHPFKPCGLWVILRPRFPLQLETYTLGYDLVALHRPRLMHLSHQCPYIPHDSHVPCAQGFQTL